MKTNFTLPLTGGCQCGALRYEVTGQPIIHYICHCRECQKQSSSAFGISVLVNSTDFCLISGNPKIWTRAATVQGSLDCAFCPTCGSRVWHGDLDHSPIISIKGGSLDDIPDIGDVAHCWISSKVAGVHIPAHAEIYQHNPPDKD